MYLSHDHIVHSIAFSLCLTPAQKDSPSEFCKLHSDLAVKESVG